MATSPENTSTTTQERFYRFNNSRSEKHPMWLWGKFGDDGRFYTIGAGRFFSVDGLTEVTEEEYKKVEASDVATSNPTVGDRVVVLEYASTKKRYGKIVEIIPPRPELSISKVVVLDNGDRWIISHVRHDSFIHTLKQL